MSFLKYVSERGARAVPRTADGFPIRGDRVPFLKQHEYEDIGLGFDARVRVFATDRPEEMAEYQQVLDQIANGMFVRLAPDKEEFLADRRCWLVLVRWAEVKGELSPQLLAAAGGYTR